MLAVILLFVLVLAACTNNATTNERAAYANAAKLLTEVKTTQFFTEEEVSYEDVEQILLAGMNTPSAMNTQPWHFTAVTAASVRNSFDDIVTMISK